MSTPITRDELDRRMEAWALYFDEDEPWSLERIAKQMHTRHETVREWITSLGGTIRPPHVNSAMTNTVRERDRRAAKLKDGEAICHCGLIYMETGDGQCPSCAGDNEQETEREAEEALFSGSAFINNRRNIGRFDPRVCGRRVGGYA
jgi:hypothetical protein